jgi:VWFA-related protein
MVIGFKRCANIWIGADKFLPAVLSLQVPPCPELYDSSLRIESKAGIEAHLTKFYGKFQRRIRGSSQCELICIAVFVLASIAHAQTGSLPAPLMGPSSSLVLVPALARSPSGDLVSGLRADDFEVIDNGQPQKIRTDYVDMEHLALVVVMQSGSGVPAQLQSYQTLTRLVAGMFGSSIPRVGLVTFDSRVEEIWNFPPRLDGLKHAFRKPDGGDGGAAIIDALQCATGLLKTQPAAFRRVILLLSQPPDAGSRAASTALAQQLGENNVTVYSVAFKPHNSHRIRKRTKPSRETPTSNEASYAAAELRSIASKLETDTSTESAELTGGEHIWLNDADQLLSVLSTLRNDFANTYLLSFQPTSGQPGFHSIHVRLRKKSSKTALAARQAYWRGSE